MELYALLVANANPGPGQSLPRLAGVRNDAEMLRAALWGAGAKVTLLVDATAAEVNDAIRRVSSFARKGDRVVFWFAGHMIHDDRLGATVPIFADTELARINQTFDELVEGFAATLSPGHLIVLIDAYGQAPLSRRGLVADHSSFVCVSDDERAHSEFARTLVAAIDTRVEGSASPSLKGELFATHDLFDDVVSNLRQMGQEFQVRYVGERVGFVESESTPMLDDNEEDDARHSAAPRDGSLFPPRNVDDDDEWEDEDDDWEDDEEDEEEEEGDTGEQMGQPRVFRVWFGTNRNSLVEGSGGARFGARRSAQVCYGSCEVVIPKSHLTGSIGSSWWRRLLRWDDDRVKLLSTHALERDAFLQGVVRQLGGQLPPKRFALIYIHGFNVSFEGAARRAAQIGFDLGVRGVTAFFSWPSRGRTGSYLADGAAIGASEAAITEFIRTFVSETNAEQVHILAHSMGNRALLRTIEHVVNGLTEQQRSRIGQIILAAPDVDCDEFANLAKIYKLIAKRTTMYISANDRALATSGFLHEYPRAGILPPVTCVPGIDTVEATNIDLSFLGHSHYAETRALIYDMHALIHKNDPPDQRAGLDPAFNEKGEKYWRVRG